MKLSRLLIGLGAVMALASALSAQPSVPCNPCTAPDNGLGTTDFPAPCPYQPCCNNTMHIVNGLPVASTIEIQATLGSFSGVVHTPGGPLGGETVDGNAVLTMRMMGTGAMIGFVKNTSMSVQFRFECAPHTPGNLVQPFDGYLARLQGQLPPGDPDFDLLRVTAGNDFGMPSPGHTTFSVDAANYSVESFFDITYRIDFVGNPGGPLAGMSGSTTDAIRFYQGCPRWRPGDSHKMHFAQHPDEKGWNVQATYPRRLADDWLCTETGPVKDLHFWGSFLGGQRERIRAFYFEIYSDVPAGVDYPYSHPGLLLWADTVQDYVMTPLTPGLFEGWYDPYSGGFVSNDHNEYWQYDILIRPAKWFNQVAGTIYWLSISTELVDTLSGHRWGWKSTLDHFNDDAVYQPFSSPGTCVAPDNGGGTATQPALCPFDNNDLWFISNGLPPGTTIECTPLVHSIAGVIEAPGGGLGGTQSQFSAQMQFKMNGTGAFLGYTRVVNMPLPVNQTHHGPRLPFSSPQLFPTDFFGMQGQLPPGDPDFDLLRITAGTSFGMPSPGHTTLTQTGGNWNVESFFDITYRIDFVGNPGGPFAGMSGSTTGIGRIRQGTPFTPPPAPWVDLYEPPLFTQSLDLSFVITGGTPTTCCIGLTGNTDCDPADGVDISDLAALIDYLYISFTPLCCPPEGNCDGDLAGGLDIADLSALIDYLYISFTPVAPCL